MKLGLHLPIFTWPGGPAEIGARLAKIAPLAEEAGFEWISVMDHFFQLPFSGAAEREMLEAYTTLGYLAALTKRVKLLTLVTSVTYRAPGILAKQITTLDVLSGGRAILGIGAGWYEREHLAMGVRFPPLKERFERLEEELQIVQQFWSGDRGPYQGTHYQLTETINVPQVLARPPILIGGSGERKTLRLVAKYADACNVMGDPATAKHKFTVLREHCDAEGRDYDSILRTCGQRLMLGPNGERANEMVEQLGRYAEAGAQLVTCSVDDVGSLTPLEIVGRDIVPQIQGL